MPNGSNQFTKQQVQAGEICYVCEKAAPTRIDDVSGSICTDCFNHMQNAILQCILKSGYRRSSRKAK